MACQPSRVSTTAGSSTISFIVIFANAFGVWYGKASDAAIHS